MKRVVALFLVLLICIGLFSVTATASELPFSDMSPGAYYVPAVRWAVENNITKGISNSEFGPNNICTRAQVVTFLWRSVGSPKPTSSHNPFVDIDSTKFYYNAVLWAVENNITAGTSKNTFSPDDACTRGQVATFLWRAKGKPEAKGENSFNDVTANTFYYEAVLWAVENGVTNGMGAGIFAPNGLCTRGQIVTFLYRSKDISNSGDCQQHVYVVAEDHAATCTENGWRLMVCRICQDSYTEEYMPATGHQYAVAEDHAATCTENGWKLIVCGICQDSYTEESMPATGHQNVRRVSGHYDPTCTNSWRATYFCEDCSRQFYKNDKPLWHSTSDGKCDFCGYNIQTLSCGNRTLTYTQHSVETSYISADKLSKTTVKPFCELTMDEDSGKVSARISLSYKRVSGVYLWYSVWLVNEEGDVISVGTDRHIDHSGNGFGSYGHDYRVTLPEGDWMLVIATNESVAKGGW